MSSRNRERQKTANKSMPSYLTSTKKNSSWTKLFPDVVKSAKFQSMSSPAKLLYFYCKAQIADPVARASLMKHAEEEEALTGINHDAWKSKNNDRYFVFPEKHCRQYGITGAYRSKYMSELIKNGFIDVVEQNRHRFRDRKENVYALSGLWTIEQKEAEQIRQTAKGKRTQNDVALEVKAQMESEHDDFDVPDWIPFDESDTGQASCLS